MKKIDSIFIFVGLSVIILFSCKENDEDILLIDQNLSIEKVAELQQEAITIKQLEEYTNVRNTKYRQDVFHKGKTVLVYSNAESYNIYPEENRFLMKEHDSVTDQNYHLEVDIVGNNKKIFDKLIKRGGTDSLYNSLLLFPVIVKGKIEQFFCDRPYCIYLTSDDIYIP